MQPGYITSVLVPVDYSEKSVYALKYACELTRNNSGVIHALHIIDKNHEKDLQEDRLIKAREKLNSFSEKYTRILGVTIIPVVVEGDIFTTIGQKAQELGAQLIVMGIHGIKGIQFLIGSFAVRIILGSKIPVLLVNESFEYKSFKSIVLPFDPEVKMDFLVDKTIDLAKRYKSTIHLVSVLGDVGIFRKVLFLRKIDRIIKKIKKNKLAYRNVMLQDNSSESDKKIIEYALHVKADPIILPMQHQENGNGFNPAMLTSKIINDPQVPLYIVNLS